MRDSDSDKWEFWVIGLSFLAMGVFNIVDGITTAYRIFNWQNTQGTITSSVLNPCIRGGRAGGSGSYPSIGYSYSINNLVYTGTRIAPSSYSDCVRDREAYEIISKFPVNTKVIVRSNPEQPSDSFVFGGKIGHWYDFPLIIGGILCIFLAPYASSRILFSKHDRIG
jgi:hypothetical protein